MGRDSYNTAMAIRYTDKEELWNSWSHAGGIVLGVAVGIIFIVMSFKGDNPWARLGVCLYLFGMLASYIASTVYHALPRRSIWKERLRHWDHAAIYWHIAGSYSPLTLVALRTQGYWGWALFVFVWTCAIAGTIISFIKLKEHSNVETACFIGMTIHPRSLQTAHRQCLDSRRSVDCRRGRMLHHGSSVLQPEQPPLHALGIPLLCPRRLRVPHHRRLGRADGHVLNEE